MSSGRHPDVRDDENDARNDERDDARAHAPATARNHEPILAVLTEGTPVFSQRSRAEWIQVRTLRGTVGWVHASLLSQQ